MYLSLKREVFTASHASRDCWVWSTGCCTGGCLPSCGPKVGGSSAADSSANQVIQRQTELMFYDRTTYWDGLRSCGAWTNLSPPGPWKDANFRRPLRGQFSTVPKPSFGSNITIVSKDLFQRFSISTKISLDHSRFFVTSPNSWTFFGKVYGNFVKFHEKGP